MYVHGYRYILRASTHFLGGLDVNGRSKGVIAEAGGVLLLVLLRALRVVQ